MYETPDVAPSPTEVCTQYTARVYTSYTFARMSSSRDLIMNVGGIGRVG